LQIGWKAVIAAGLLLTLIWPALYNGQPIFNPDTPSYIRTADAGIAKLTGRETVWSARWQTATTSTQPSSASEVLPQNIGALHPDFVLTGRSIYYGALLYFGDAVGYLWPSIVIQAAVVLLALGLTLRNMGLFSWRLMAIAVGGLAVLSPLPFYTSLLIPDIFAGVAILATANLVVFGGRMTRSLLFVWVILLTAALSFHESIVPITVGLLCIGLVAHLLGWDACRAGIVAVVLALALAAAGEAAFTQSVKKVMGIYPIRPPFLMARLIADGPGTAYLRANCPQAGFTICRYLDRLWAGNPSDRSEAFLWGADVANGAVFMTVDAATRRALSDEQLSFALATVAFDPIGEIKAAAYDVFHQLGMIGAGRWFEYAISADSFRERVPSPYFEVMEKTKAWSGDLPTTSMSVLSPLVALAAMVYLLVMVTWRRKQSTATPWLFTTIIISGIIFNAAVCGAISGPHYRYQTRVIWLIPLTAFLMHYNRRVTSLNEHLDDLRTVRYSGSPDGRFVPESPIEAARIISL
jgi:hypothetical protein